MSTISVIDGYFSSKRTKYIDNYASNDTNAIFGVNVRVHSEDDIFSSTLDIVQSLKTKGHRNKGYLVMFFNGELFFIDAVVVNGLSQNGGAAYIGALSYLYSSRTTFQNNFAVQKGGALFIYNSKASQVFKSSFLNNSAGICADEIHYSQTQNKLKIHDSRFINGIGSQLIFVDTASLNIQITKLVFERPSNRTDVNGGGVYCLNCYSIRISVVDFANMSGKFGGAIHIQETPNFLMNRKEIKSYSSEYDDVLFSGLKFYNCTALLGGAIYIHDSLQLTIEETGFQGNRAISVPGEYSGYGGAIYFSSSGASNYTQLNLKLDNKFHYNYADNAGGAIYWNNIEPRFMNQTLKLRMSEMMNSTNFTKPFYGNKAKYYGRNIAGYPIRMIFLRSSFLDKRRQLLTDYTSHQFRDLNIGRYIQETDANQEEEEEDGSTIFERDDSLVQLITLSDVRSGQTIERFQIGLVDIYGHVISNDHSSQIYLQADVHFNADEKALKYPPIVEGKNEFQATYGVFTLENFQFYATPGYNHSILITTSEIDLSKDSSEYLMQKLNRSDLDQKIAINLKLCEQGQQFTPSGKCIDCPPDSFFFGSMTEPGTCLSCPTGAICLGKNFIGPKRGYWRYSNSSSQFYQCFREDSCLEYSSNFKNQTSFCEIGYQGILCADCTRNYYKSSLNRCQECGHQVRTVFQIFGAAIAFILVVWLLVALLKYQNKSRLFQGGVFLKFFINHIQMLLVTFSISFQKTVSLKLLKEGLMNMSLFGLKVYDIDCLLDRTEEQQQQESHIFGLRRLSTVKLFASTIFPIAIAIISLTVFIFLSLARVKVSKSSFTTCIMCGLYLIQPAVIYQFFRFIMYKSIEGVYRVSFDLEIQKDGPDHQFAVQTLGIPGFLIWGIGLPMLAYYFILRNNRKNFSDCYQACLLVLLGGYKNRYYYWDILLILRRQTLLVLIVLSFQLGEVVKTILLQSVFFICLIVNLSLRPFSRDDFLRLENLSLVIQFLTLQVGLLMEVDVTSSFKNQSEANLEVGIVMSSATLEGLSALIILVNLSYLVAWGYLFSKSLKLLLINKFARAYLCLAQSCKVNKLSMPRLSAQLETSYLVEQEREVQSHYALLEEYFALTLRIKKLYSMEGTIVTEAGIMKLREQLYPGRIKKMLQKSKSQVFNPQDQEEFMERRRQPSLSNQGVERKSKFNARKAFAKSQRVPLNSGQLLGLSDRDEPFEEKKQFKNMD